MPPSGADSGGSDRDPYLSPDPSPSFDRSLSFDPQHPTPRFCLRAVHSAYGPSSLRGSRYSLFGIDWLDRAPPPYTDFFISYTAKLHARASSLIRVSLRIRISAFIILANFLV